MHSFARFFHKNVPYSFNTQPINKVSMSYLFPSQDIKLHQIIFKLYISICIKFYEIQSADKNILNQSENEIAEQLLYGSSQFKLQQNCCILRSSIKLIIKSERFSGYPILQ